MAIWKWRQGSAWKAIEQQTQHRQPIEARPRRLQPLGLALEDPLPDNLEWLGKDTTDSPLVNNPSPGSGLLALTQVFK